MLVMILVWLVPFFSTMRLNAEKYQLLLAEKIANDVNFLAYDSNRLRRYLHNIKIGENGFVYIIDRFGRLIFYSPNFLTVREQSLGASAPVRGVGWQVVVGVPFSEALGEQYAVLTFAFLMFLVSLLLVILLLLVVKKLVRGDHRKPFRLLLHKIRTPLSSVKWNLYSLLAGDWGTMPDQQRKFLERSYDANQQLIKLTDQLADSVALEANCDNFIFAKDDVVGLVKEVVGEFKTEAKKANVKIIFEEPQKAPPPIPMDRKKIKLALGNVLDNAIRYNLSGGQVTIKIFKEKGMIAIEFSDTGIGIAANQRPKLFSKFFRTAAATRIQSSGFGLGLYIAKLIIEGHCGKISVESQEHKGSTFFVFLPL